MTFTYGLIPCEELKQTRQELSWDGDKYPAGTPVYLVNKPKEWTPRRLGFIPVTIPGKSCLFRFVSLLESDLEPYHEADR